MGSEGDPSELLSEETERERCLWYAAAVLIGTGLWRGTLSVLLLSMVSWCRERDGESARR